MRSWKLLLLALAVSPARSVAQTSPPSCGAAEHGQFDFWLGSWAVFNPQGEQVGVYTITSQLNGCVLHEHWESLRSAHRGNSYSIYHRVSGQWHQTWVDSPGLLLLLEGGLREGAMILEGRSRRANGSEQLERITWTRCPMARFASCGSSLRTPGGRGPWPSTAATGGVPDHPGGS